MDEKDSMSDALIDCVRYCSNDPVFIATFNEEFGCDLPRNRTPDVEDKLFYCVVNRVFIPTMNDLLQSKGDPRRLTVVDDALILMRPH